MTENNTVTSNLTGEYTVVQSTSTQSSTVTTNTTMGAYTAPTSTSSGSGSSTTTMSSGTYNPPTSSESGSSSSTTTTSSTGANKPTTSSGSETSSTTTTATPSNSTGTYTPPTSLSSGIGSTTTTTTIGTTSNKKPTIISDSRDIVIVEKESDSSYSRIVFSDGKIWHCINHDIINDYTLNMNEPFSQRFFENLYETKVVDEVSRQVYYYEPLKEYTDEEIKLIYTIDPYGLVAYVKEYASKLFKDGDGVQDSLGKVIGYKDDIFYLLFGHHPKYYRRYWDGTWYQTSDKSDWTDVLSESEFLFDGHPIYDGCFWLEFVAIVLDVISIAIACPAIAKFEKVTKVVSAFIKYCSMGRSVVKSVLDEDFNGFISAVVNGFIDEDKLEENFIVPSEYRTQNYTLGWASELLSFSSDLGALADTFSNGPHFYKEVFTHCNEDLDYNIMIRTSDNKFISISEINNVIE